MPALLFVMHDPPFEPARFIDDAFEEPRDGVGAERPLGGNGADVSDHFLLASRLVDLDAEFLFQPADLADAPGPLVEQADEDFIDAIDVLA